MILICQPRTRTHNSQVSKSSFERDDESVGLSRSWQAGKPVELHMEELWDHNIPLTTRLLDTTTTPMLPKIFHSGKLQRGNRRVGGAGGIKTKSYALSFSLGSRVRDNLCRSSRCSKPRSPQSPVSVFTGAIC
jgi:hypothetical protein